jgi:hypothetical protein
MATPEKERFMNGVRRLVVAVVVSVCLPALVAAAVYTITIDENGNGTITIPTGQVTALTFQIGTDPGPGGLSNVLIYSGLPFNGVQGDLGLTDADAGGATYDYIRFNGDGTIAFYSDNVDGYDSLADTSGPPGAFYTNILRIPEVGPEGNNGALYTPTEGQPGFFNLDFGVNYNITSDSVPEPGTWLLVSLGLAGVAWKASRRRNKA